MKLINKFIKDKRGAALVYVIVAAAIIVLLGAATTVTAYVNLQNMRVREISTNNFYGADTVMNAIVSGLESDISAAYETAYTQMITDSRDETVSEEQLRASFNKLFKDEIRTKLSDEKESFRFYYNLSRIKGYVEQIYPQDISYTVTALNGNNYIDDTETGVILRNLHVTYESDNGYYDEITTDIKIDVPDPGFAPQLTPQFKIDAIVIDDGLKINAGKGLEIIGNIYIDEDENHSAILLESGSALSIVTPNELIAGGNVETKENTRFQLGTLGNTHSNFAWIENINFGRNTIADLSGELHIYDDLEINGSYSSVKLAGKYYGYNRSHSYVAESSSININGAQTKLDIRGLDTLLIGGTSYLSTAAVSGNRTEDGKTDDDKNIQLGEALSVKSNQIAYLVDDTEFANATRSDFTNASQYTDEYIKNFVDLFVSNPMTYKQYDDLCKACKKDGCAQCEEDDGWHEVAKLMASKKLSYGKTYSEYGADVIRVFSNKDIDGAVYFYLDFADAGKASAFFRAAYDGNTLLSQRLRTYAAQYIERLNVSSDTQLLVNENYINSSIALYTNTSLPTLEDGLGYQEYGDENTAALIDAKLTQYKTQYLGTGANSLSECKRDGDGEKYKVTYEKLINSEQLKSFIINATDAKNSATDGIVNNTNNQIEIVPFGVKLTGTSGHQAIIVDNEGHAAYELGSGSGLVIVSGDLKLTGNWLGTIIVGGKVYCDGGSQDVKINITADAMAVSSVTPLYFTLNSTSMGVLNIFNEYEDVAVGKATTSSIDADRISQCVSFTNWDKD